VAPPLESPLARVGALLGMGMAIGSDTLAGGGLVRSTADLPTAARRAGLPLCLRMLMLMGDGEGVKDVVSEWGLGGRYEAVRRGSRRATDMTHNDAESRCMLPVSADLQHQNMTDTEAW